MRARKRSWPILAPNSLRAFPHVVHGACHSRLPATRMLPLPLTLNIDGARSLTTPPERKVPSIPTWGSRRRGRIVRVSAACSTAACAASPRQPRNAVMRLHGPPANERRAPPRRPTTYGRQDSVELNRSAPTTPSTWQACPRRSKAFPLARGAARMECKASWPRPASRIAHPRPRRSRRAPPPSTCP